MEFSHIPNYGLSPRVYSYQCTTDLNWTLIKLEYVFILKRIPLYFAWRSQNFDFTEMQTKKVYGGVSIIKQKWSGGGKSRALICMQNLL